MLIVANNTPLRYLILLGYVDILPALYGRILIPQAVLQELQHPHTPVLVRSWMANVPSWLEVGQAVGGADAAVLELDAGERYDMPLARARFAAWLGSEKCYGE